jgi:hypothetical protein
MRKSAAAWVAERLCELDHVDSCEVIDEHLIEVSRKSMINAQIACVRVDEFETRDVDSILAKYPSIDFILNIPKNAKTAGEAYRKAASKGIAIGVGDAMRAVAYEDPGSYIHPQTKYIERILSQHSRVEGFERIDNARYRIVRRSLPPLTVYISGAYEVTVDELRTAIEEYGEFDIFVTANPNALAISPQATNAARNAQRRVLQWVGFMSALHRDRA